MHNEIQEVMGQTFGVPDDIDEDELLGELDALEDELAAEAENAQAAGGVPSYLQVCRVLLPSGPTSAHLVDGSCACTLISVLVSGFSMYVLNRSNR